MMKQWFSRFGRQPFADLSHLHLVVFSRAGCHLCDDAWQLLAQLQRQYQFSLEITDVDNDPKLQQQFGNDVPVVTVNGKVRFRGCVNRILLTRLLDAEASKKTDG